MTKSLILFTCDKTQEFCQRNFVMVRSSLTPRTLLNIHMNIQVQVWLQPYLDMMNSPESNNIEFLLWLKSVNYYMTYVWQVRSQLVEGVRERSIAHSMK